MYQRNDFPKECPFDLKLQIVRICLYLYSIQKLEVSKNSKALDLLLVYQKCARLSSQKSKGGATVAPRLVIPRDAWRVQKTKKLPLKVVGTGLENGFCDFQLHVFFISIAFISILRLRFPEN